MMMKHTWHRAMVLSVAALTLSAAPALAGGDKAQSHPSASPSTQADFTGRHTMSGEVTRVDANKGTMSLKTHEGTMDLHFPPSALQGVKKGDHVSVELALKNDRGR